MVQARGPRRRRRPAQALPGVQPDVVVVAARRDERRLRAVPLGDLEAEDAAVEPQRPLQVGDLQVDVADADLGIDRAGVSRRRSWGVLPVERRFDSALSVRPLVRQGAFDHRPVGIEYSIVDRQAWRQESDHERPRPQDLRDRLRREGPLGHRQAAAGVRRGRRPGDGGGPRCGLRHRRERPVLRRAGPSRPGHRLPRRPDPGGQAEGRRSVAWTPSSSRWTP